MDYLPKHDITNLRVQKLSVVFSEDFVSLVIMFINRVSRTMEAKTVMVL